ncbi:MAG TPA: replication-associated recombination protein A [Bacteroidetes bacterium]|nr:replication-associated recombination protein A [Bacteroidota bacterium]
MDLFDQIDKEQQRQDAPLADFMRPQTLDEYIGQQHLVGEGAPIRLLMENRRAISMILQGPPGVGKTSLARIFASEVDGMFFTLSAVSAGVADVRRVIDRARANRKSGQRTILFIDEIHRFNKSQQDALLHSVEDGTLFLIGATTENPSFEVISPLLSRCRVFTLQPLTEQEATALLERARTAWLQKNAEHILLDDEAEELLIRFANGDGRELINGLELAAHLSRELDGDKRHIRAAQVAMAFQRRVVRYDKAGDAHYDTISAFIKSLRGSDPDAAMHYLARMLEAGEEPRFIARRMIIFASEDIGNADPFALVLASTTFDAVHNIGMPEARIILAQAVTYLASAPKSNASYRAIDAAQQALAGKTLPPIPLHLRNAPTKLMKAQGYGKEYQYPHNFPGHFVKENYLPEGYGRDVYYHPTEQGREKSISERLKQLWPGRYKAERKKEKQQ